MCKTKQPRHKVPNFELKAPQAYLEYVAKSYKNEKADVLTTEERPKQRWQIDYEEGDLEQSAYSAAGDAQALRSCGAYFVKGIGKNDQVIYKAMYCGRQWCPRCGKGGSVMHRRKVGRLWARFMSLESWGYFVGTIPHYIDGKYMLGRIAAKELDYMATSFKRFLKRQGYELGVCVWHFSGDKHKGTNYNPHINIVIQEGFLSPTRLEAIKAYWSKLVCKVLKIKKVDIISNYEYTDDMNKAIHLVKYITRATYKGTDRHIRNIITKFRNIRTWGKFAKPTQESENLALQELKGLDVYRAGVKALEVVHINEFRAYHKTNRLEYIGLGLWLQLKAKEKRTNCYTVTERNSILYEKSSLLFYNFKTIGANHAHTFAKQAKTPLFYRKTLADLTAAYSNAFARFGKIEFLEPDWLNWAKPEPSAWVPCEYNPYA